MKSRCSAQYGNGLNGWGSWNFNPLNTGTVSWDRFNTLENSALVAAQDMLVRKTVSELNGFDSVYYAATITATELKLPLKHPIAHNVANGYATVESPNPAVSIFNFHYASPPREVQQRLQ